MLSAGIDEMSEVGWKYLSRDRAESSLPWSRFMSSISKGEWPGGWFSSVAELEELSSTADSSSDLCLWGELREMRRE